MDTSILKRAELVPLLVDAAKKVVMYTGVDENFHGGKGTVRAAELENISLLYRTPKADIIGAPSTFGVDVWYDGKKTFSASWNSNLLRDFELVFLKRGPWISELLARAARITTK